MTPVSCAVICLATQFGHLTSRGMGWWWALGLALLGTASSTVFLGMALVASWRQKRLARQQQRIVDATPIAALPHVSVLKPLCGAEPRLEENLESFFRQDYPSFELIFGCRHDNDPALAVVARLRQRYPQIPVRIVLAGEPEWPSAKVWSLDKMEAQASSDYLVMSDSDVLVRPDFLRNIVPSMLPPDNGVVTCLYEGVPAPDFWSRLEALGMSVEMASGVMTADMLEGMRFALGVVMTVRRDVLHKIGGMAVLADYCSDDFVLGKLAFEAGYHVVLSHYRVSHVLCAQTLRGTFTTQVRWMKGTRHSRPKGHLGTGLTFALPFGILGGVAATACAHPWLGLALFVWACLNRIIQCVAVGYGIVGDRRALRDCWLYPVRDLLGFIVWVFSYCGSNSIFWRGELYRFTPDGRIVNVMRSKEAHTN